MVGSLRMAASTSGVASDTASLPSKVNVYDLTDWEDKHPGGAERIIALCGTDGSSAFDDQHSGEPEPEDMLAEYKIGVLAQ